jgi:hypothetical protein
MKVHGSDTRNVRARLKVFGSLGGWPAVAKATGGELVGRLMCVLTLLTFSSAGKVLPYSPYSHTLTPATIAELSAFTCLFLRCKYLA